MSKLYERNNSVKTVIFDMNSSPYIDITGTRLLKRLFTDLKAKGISLKIAEARSEVRDKLRSENLEDLFGHFSRLVSVDDLVEESVKQH